MNEELQQLPETKKKVDFERDVREVKAALEALGEPQLDTVTYSGITEYGCKLSASGFFEVKIDQRAVSAVLLACGVPKNQLKNVEITFRAAQLPDTNYWGDTIAGLKMSHDDEHGFTNYVIEVYTSLPQSSTVKDGAIRHEMSRNTAHNFGVKEEVIIQTLLEELRHVIQDSLNLFDTERGSFEAKDPAEFHDIDFEIDAGKFLKKLTSSFIPFVSVTMLSEVSDLVVTDVDDTFPKALWQHLDAQRAIAVIYDDVPGKVLLDNLKLIDLLDEQSVDKFLNQVKTFLHQREIGFTEARMLYLDLIVKLVEQGNSDFILKVEPLLLDIS